MEVFRAKRSLYNLGCGILGYCLEQLEAILAHVALKIKGSLAGVSFDIVNGNEMVVLLRC